jgi:hypothetical protein
MSRVIDGLRAAGRKLAGTLGRSEEPVRWDERVKIPVFIVGCQRSGTTMLTKLLTACPQMRVYGEHHKEAFTEGVRIRPEAVIRSLIHDSPEPIVVFKPLNDTQYADNLLNIQPNTKAIWMYRHFHDVVNLLVEKWGDAQVEAVRQIADGTYSGPGSEALGERVSQEDLALTRRLNERGLTPVDAAAFIWYLRNIIYYDLNLDTEPAVLLSKYEDTVTDPERYVRRLFDFIGGAFSSRYVAEVSPASINKCAPPTLDAEITRLCSELLDRIDASYHRQLENELS